MHSRATPASADTPATCQALVEAPSTLCGRTDTARYQVHGVEVDLCPKHAAQYPDAVAITPDIPPAA